MNAKIVLLPGDGIGPEVVAQAERVLLFRRLFPTGVPGMVAFELAIGDAARALTDEEIGTYFGHILATAGA